MRDDSDPRFRAERINTDSKWYDLFQKGVELGTWNVEKLIDQIGFEEDREIWRSLDDDERRQIRYLLSGFLDGEHEVGQDASHHLHRMMAAPCLADNETKEMYVTMLTLTEHKHTQFLDIYMAEVLSERDNYADLDPRRRGARVPVVQATGLGEVFEHQGLVTAKAAHTLDPVDIAKATTVYHMNVEGLLARGGFYAINKLSRHAPLPLLNRAFKFVSTDEGRHLTHGVELLRELIEHEEEGIPEYQGVKQGIVDMLYEDAPAIADFGYMFTDGVDDPLEIEFDDLLLHVGRLIDGQYNEALGLDVDYHQVVARVSDRYEECTEMNLEEQVREHEERYRRKRGVAADGGG